MPKNPKKMHARTKGVLIYLSISFCNYESTKLKEFSVKLMLNNAISISIFFRMSFPNSASFALVD